MRHNLGHSIMYVSGQSIAKSKVKIARNVDGKCSIILRALCGTFSRSILHPETTEFQIKIMGYGSQCMGKEAIIFFQHTCSTVH